MDSTKTGLPTPLCALKRKVGVIDLIDSNSDSDVEITKTVKRGRNANTSSHTTAEMAPDSYLDPVPSRTYSPNQSPVKQPSSTKFTPRKKNEKRPKRYRPVPSAAVLERMECAESQRMFVLSRNKTGELCEDFTVAGTTGNVYNVTISPTPYCSCPDRGARITCKHILYIMMKVLRAPPNLVYQMGLLTSELEEIFEKASCAHRIGGGEDSEDKRRKVLYEDDCPICYCPFSEQDIKGQILWCKGQCGTNVHKSCFLKWKTSTMAMGKRLTCVMCRGPWVEDLDTC